MSQTQSDITKERLFEEFNAVVADTEQLLKSVASAGGDKAASYKARVEDGLTAAGDRLAKIREASLGQAHAAARATDTYVQDNPWRTAGIVAALSAVTGLIAGFLLARR